MMISNSSESEKKSNHELPQQPWAQEIRDILHYFSVEQKEGLNREQVKKQNIKFEPNKLKQAKKRSIFSILANQVKSVVVAVLAAAGAVSFILEQVLEGIAIVVALLINTLIGFFTELKAVRSMEALRELGKVKTKVRRSGKINEIPAEDVVPGDIMILESGDIVTADIRIVDSSKLQGDESALTGESEPVTKSKDPVDKRAPVAERTSMLYKGTSVTRGTAEGVVVATGMDTEIGKITSLAEEAKEEGTLLEKRLNRMGHRLVWATLGIIVLIATTGYLAGRDIFIVLETAIALAIAAIPEGLPIVASLSLTRGVWRMVQNDALVNKLSSVETLGATSIIFADKTETLTENRMKIKKIQTSSGTTDMDDKKIKDNALVREALTIGVLCNNAVFAEESGEQSMGEPLELAFLEAGFLLNIKRDDLLKSMPEKKEISFDPEIKLMGTFHQKNKEYLVAVKGAPEAILEICSKIKTNKNTVELETGKRKEWKNIR
jgi:P-type Ca2+ transporter type 2C